MPTTTVTKGYNNPTGWISGETVTPEKLNFSQTPSVSVTIDDGDITESKIATGAVTGAAGGGKLAASAITSQTTIADLLADTDEFLVHDASASALRKVAFSSLQTTGTVLQTEQVVKTTTQTCSTTIPGDDSVPQNSEGNEVLTASIEPSSESNKVLVTVNLHGTTPGGGVYGAVALFRGSEVNAIATAFNRTGSGGAIQTNWTIVHLDSPSTTSLITYSVRAGASSGSLHVNANDLGNRVYGGALVSSITLQEIKA